MLPKQARKHISIAFSQPAAPDCRECTILGQRPVNRAHKIVKRNLLPTFLSRSVCQSAPKKWVLHLLPHFPSFTHSLHHLSHSLFSFNVVPLSLSLSLSLSTVLPVLPDRLLLLLLPLPLLFNGSPRPELSLLDTQVREERQIYSKSVWRLSYI